MEISLTIILIIMTCLISYPAFSNPTMKSTLMMYPVGVKSNNEYYRFLTSGFVHADMMHLGINMYVLWMFGTTVENYFMAIFDPMMGRVFYLLVYFGSIIFGSLPSYFKHSDNRAYAALGASGGTSGVLLAYVLFGPWEGLTFIFFPFFAFPAIVLAIGYLVYSSWASKNSNDNIGHDAHFWGAIFGFMATLTLIAVFSPPHLSFFYDNFVNGFSELF